MNRDTFFLAKAVATALLLTTLNSCSQLPPASDRPPETEDSVPDKSRVNLPNHELGGELTFRLLTAEFARQKGDHLAAAHHYLAAAFTTRDPRLAQYATEAAFNAKQYPLATTASQLWLELDDESEGPVRALAILLVNQGQLDAATPHLRAILRNSLNRDGDTEQRTAHVKESLAILTTILAESTQSDAALNLFAELLNTLEKEQTTLNRSFIDHESRLIMQATLALRLNRRSQAAAYIETLLSENPGHYDGNRLQVQLLASQGLGQEALKRLGENIAAAPPSLDLHHYYAKLLIQYERYEDALHIFRELATKYPEEGEISYSHALLALQLNHHEEGKTQLLKLVDDPEYSANARQALGQVTELDGDLNAAINWYRSITPAAEENPHNGNHPYLNAQFRAAALIAKQNSLGAAITHLEGIYIGSDNDSLRRLSALAEIHLQQNEPVTAINYYDQALAIAPDDKDIRYARALAYEKIDRIDLLEADLKLILSQHPAEVNALNALGFTLADRTDRYLEALDYIQRALQQQPKDAAILDSLGWVLYRLQRLDEALDYARQAHELLKDGEIAAHYGEILWATGDKSAARDIWEQAGQFAPNHPVLQKTIKRFLP
ncbi:MAG: tetratricopeptide repeat protein [Gammaproteobacteria bacterium]|nr:tetratricopeptide repeat protein [Gammaproteobacteria bacterium]